MARDRGAGTFSKLADGRWQYRISLGVEGGERHRRRFYGRTQAECREQAEEYRRNLRLGLPTDTSELLRDYLPRWIEGRRHELRPRTFDWYSDHININLVPYVGGVEVASLGRRHVVDLMARLSRKGLAPRTVNGAKVTLGGAMQDALRDGAVTQNVVRLVRQLPQPRAEIVPLTAKEIETFRDRVRGSRGEPLYTLALAFGLRQGELLGLTWDDVNFDLRILNITHALQNHYNGNFALVEVKTAQSRRALVMPDFVAASLHRQREQQAADRKRMGSHWPDFWPDLVFREPTGSPVHGETLTRRFQAMLAELGIPRRRFHDLRHTCATFLLMSGVELKVIQTILGHSTIAVTSAVYAHVLPQMQEAAFEHMRSILSEQAVEVR